MKQIFLSLFLISTFTSYSLYARILNKPTPVATVPSEMIKQPELNIKTKEEGIGYEVIIPKPKPVISLTTKTAPVVTQEPALAPVVTQKSAPAPVSQPAQTPIQSTGLYKSGTYTGKSVDATYGNIQVSALIMGGELVDVQFLDYPQGKQESIQKNLRAMPILTSEAIIIQDSKVDNVSGATFTTQAYRESLTSALAQAKL